MENKADFRPLIDEVRRSESVTCPAFLCRLALILCGCLIGWLVLGLDILPYWLTAYYGAVFVEKFLLLQYPQAATRGFVVAVSIVSFLISCAFFALPVYLWFLPGDIWKFASTVLLVTGCLNIHQLRSRVLPVTLAYFVPMGAAFFIIATDFWSTPGAAGPFWAALALASLVAGYFGLCIFEAQRANTRDLRTRTHLLRSQKVEALEALATGISQEFRTALSIVQGNLELLQERPNETDRQACIRDAMAGVRTGSQLSSQLELYARPTQASVSTVDPLRVVENVHRMARHVLPRTIKLHVQTPSTMDQLHLDESALQAVLLNLIVYARDAAGGTGLLSLETYVTEQERAHGQPRNGATVVFEVSETGSDTTPDVVVRLDDPEYGSASDHQRNGLTLATARGFAERSGGEFNIRYGRERGTRMCLHLPA